MNPKKLATHPAFLNKDEVDKILSENERIPTSKATYEELYEYLEKFKIQVIERGIDYHGFFDDDLEVIIQKLLDDEVYMTEIAIKDSE